ncbi:MAG TPA: hypothetical protein ENH11_06980 [Candidatus Acetothermia bacterium]|nr:hypothetical protein [Candidatus Acetothermia bacterium]
MPLTEQEKKEYVGAGGGYCPYCHSERVGAAYNEGGYLELKIECNDCGKLWVSVAAIYDLVELPEEATTMIPARVVANRCLESVEFDAAPWFRQASDADILTLFQQGRSGAGMANNVAVFVADHCPKLKLMLDFIYDHNRCNVRHRAGFECQVDPEEARAWVVGNRPGIKVEEEEEE